MSEATELATLPPEIEALTARPYPGVPPGFVIRTVMALRRKFRHLADSLVPPDVVMFERTTGLVFTAVLGACARHKVANLLAGGPLTTSELASRMGTDPDATHRMMRGLAHTGIFVMHPDGRVENNRLSEALRANRLSAVRDFCVYFATRSNAEAWLDFEHTLESGKNAFVRTHGKSVWEWFDEHPDEREGFARAMMGMTVGDAPVVAGLYPWKELQRICDVGGGRGTLLSEILVRHTHLKGVLCDAPGVIQSARQLLARRGIAERVELVPGSFFDQVPSGVQAHLLKNVLHDWDDERCIKILKVVRAAAGAGGKLVVIEMLVGRNQTESFGTLADLQMMVVCDEGRERSREDFDRLFQASGWKLGRVFESPTVSVIEGVAA